MHAPDPRGLTRRRLAMALPLLRAAAFCQPPCRRKRRRGGACTAQSHGTQVDMVAQGADAAVLRRAMERCLAWEMERQADWMTRFPPRQHGQRHQPRGGKQAVAVPSQVMAVLQSAQADPTQVPLMQPWAHSLAFRFRRPPRTQRPGNRQPASSGGLPWRCWTPTKGTAYLRKAGMALDLGASPSCPFWRRARP